MAARLLEYLESNQPADFAASLGHVGEALDTCGAEGRREAIGVLFGDFTRRAIAAGVDRTRFVEWLRPAALFAAPNGRVRGRVLYFSNAKGRGKLLGADGIVYFVHFSQIHAVGFRTVDGGQLVEFTPRFESINGRLGFGAHDVAKLSETGEVQNAHDAG